MQKRGYHDISFKFYVHSTKKLRWGTLRCITKFSGIEIFMQKRGYHWTPLKILCLTVPIKFVEEPFCVSKGFWYRNFSSQRGGKLHNFVKNFFLTGPKKLRWGNILSFRKLLEWKIFFTKKGVISRFSGKKFLSDCTKMFRWRTLLCFRKNFFSKSFMHRRRGHHGSVELFFVSQDRNEKLCKGTLLFSWIFLVSKEIYGLEGAYHDFQSKFLCLTMPKNFVGIPSMFHKIWGIENFLCLIGGITFFRRGFMISQCRKISWASLQSVKKFGVSIHFMHNRGDHVFPAKIFGLTVRKNFMGILLANAVVLTYCCHLFLDEKNWQFCTEKKQDGRLAASTGIFFAGIQIFLIDFCSQLKTRLLFKI